MMKIDPSGNLIWARQVGGAASDLGYAARLDNQGNVFVTGFFQGSADFDPGTGVNMLTSVGNYDTFIWKLDPNGNLLWAKQFGGIGVDVGRGMTTDALNNVYLTGPFSNTVDFDPGPGVYNLTSISTNSMFVVKLDATGEFQCAACFTGTGQSHGQSVIATGTGGIVALGHFSNTIDFVPGPGSLPLTATMGSDIFVVNFTCNGPIILPTTKLLDVSVTALGNANTLQWRMSQATDIQTLEVEHSADGTSFSLLGQVPLQGNGQSEAEYTFHLAPAARGWHHYRIKSVDLNGGTSYPEIVKDQIISQTYFELFPHPVQSMLNVKVAAQGDLQLTVFGADGREWKHLTHQAADHSELLTIDVAELPAGLYFLRLALAEGGMQVGSFVKL